MDDLLRDFVVETSEHLETVDAELVKFERDPNNGATLALIFRLVHTIKGTCGFLGLPRLERLAHAAEDVISQFRDGKPVTAPAVTMILKTIDRIKGIVFELEQSGTEPDGDDEDLIAVLKALAKEEPAAAPAAPAIPQKSSSPPIPVDTTGTLAFQVLERPLKDDEVTLDDLERAFREAPGRTPSNSSSRPQCPRLHRLRLQWQPPQPHRLPRPPRRAQRARAKPRPMPIRCPSRPFAWPSARSIA